MNPSHFGPAEGAPAPEPGRALPPRGPSLEADAASPVPPSAPASANSAPAPFPAPPVAVPFASPSEPPPGPFPGNSADPAPRRGSLWWRLLAEYNPFYLFSAACMLASCVALTNSTSWVDIAPGTLLALILTLNVYEAVLVGLGLYLSAGRGLVRDGAMLLVLQGGFLVDVTFLNAEVITAAPATGLFINLALLLLAAAKMGLVARVLGRRLAGGPAGLMPAWKFAFALLTLGVTFALPGMFRHAEQTTAAGESMPPLYFYAAWWATGLLPAAYEVVDRLSGEGRKVAARAHETDDVPANATAGTPADASAAETTGETAAGPATESPARSAARRADRGTADPAHRGVRLPTSLARLGRLVVTLYVIQPWLSLVLHLAILHYVYDVHFHGAFAAPLLLGLTFVLHRAARRRASRLTASAGGLGARPAPAPAATGVSVLGAPVRAFRLEPAGQRQDVRNLCLLLPAAAVLVSAQGPALLDFTLPLVGGYDLLLTPLRLAGAGAYLAYVYCFLFRQALGLILAGVGLVAVKVFGPSWEQLARATSAVGRWVAVGCRALGRLVPNTSGEWGVLGLVASFLFLGLGAFVSLRKPAEKEER